MRRTMAAGLVLLGSLALASGARGGRVDPSKLAVSEVSPIAENKPEEIPGGESVSGIHPALPPSNSPVFGNVKGSHYVSLFPTQKEADAHHAGTLSSLFAKANKALEELAGGVEPGPPCFVVAQDWHMRQNQRAWPVSYESRPSVHGVEKGSPAAQQFSNVGVVAVRLEHFAPGADTASIRFTEAWLDPGTLGARKVGQGQMALTKVASGPGHVDVFAARSASGSEIHFVVGLPRHRGRASRYVGHHARISVGNQSGHSDCGHARVTLRAQPGLGQQGLVTVDVVLREPPPRTGGGSADDKAMREMVMRTLEVHLGLSQTTSDDGPIPTVSFGWQGREKRQQVY